MDQADMQEKVVKPLTKDMNLADIKMYADQDGNVEAVLLKYIRSRSAEETGLGMI